MPKNFWFWLIVLVATGLRLIAVNQSLWLDEAISVQTAVNYSTIGIISQFIPKDFNPPLYYLILHFWLTIFPSTEFFIRLPSIIFALLTLVFVYKVSNITYKETKISILAMVLLATSPLHIYYSQEARMYSLATLLAVISVYWLFRLLRDPIWHNILWYVVSTILMVYTHYLAWLLIIGQGLYVLFVKRRLITIYLWIILSYIPWLPIFQQQLAAGQKTTATNAIWSEISGRFSLKAIGLIPVKFIIGRTNFSDKYLYLISIVVLIIFFGVILWREIITDFRVRLEKTAPRAKKYGDGVILCWLLIPVILGVVTSFKIPVLSYFRFLFCLPAFYLLIAKGVFNFSNKKALITIVILINLFFSFRYLLLPQYHRENWQQAIGDLKTLNLNNRPVLIYGNVSAPLDYYFNRFEINSPVIRAEDKDLIANERIIWFIPYAQPIFDPADLTRKFLHSEGFNRTFEEHFNGVTLEKWEKMLAIRYN